MSDGMRRELVYLSSYATNRYFIPNWGNNFGINDLEICKELSADISNMPESLGTNENTTQTDGCVPILMVIGIIIAGILNLLAICKILLN